MTAFIDKANPVIAEFVGLWPSTKVFACDLGVRRETHIATMIVRGAIPLRYWRLAITGAANRNIHGINAEYLLDLHDRAQNVRVPA